MKTEKLREIFLTNPSPALFFILRRARRDSIITCLLYTSIASGGVVTLLGTREFTTLPDSLQAIYNTNIITYTAPETGFTYLLNVLFLVPVLACLGVAWMLRYTMLGRGLYAIGGDKNAARVAGYEELSGRGVRARVDGHTVCVGNGRLMDEAGAQWHECHLRCV